MVHDPYHCRVHMSAAPFRLDVNAETGGTLDGVSIRADGPAPYAPPSAILGVIKGYRDRGLTTPFTASVLQRAGVPASLAPRTLQALKLLDLIDDEGKPRTVLDDLSKAASDDVAARLAAILRGAYDEVFQFVDPREDSPERVRDAFRVYTPRGQQDRMVTLFLGLCEEANLVDPNQQRARPAGRPPRSARSKELVRQAPPDAGKSAPPEPDIEYFASPRPTAGQHPFVRGLVQMLPEVGTEWPIAKRNAWIRAALGAFDVMYELAPDDEKGGGPD